MRDGTSQPWWKAATVAAAAIVFAFSWLYRFNDPGGSFAGLTDDHFFYLVRGWQILFGDLPVRDFVDHGAPLFYYVGAAVQWFGRGTLSEVVFSVTVLSAATALTFWLAARASGSILAGLVATFVLILLEPRFYNYPKILVYALAIPALWRFADRPSHGPPFWLAVVTAVGFLLRHDHGVFVAIAFAALLALLRDLSWRERARHAVVYGGLVLALLAPYLLFIQFNGGLPQYFRDASAWAARDRVRAPVVWPGLFEETGEAMEGARAGTAPERAVAVVRDNFVAWMFYVELALPVLALLVLAVSRDGFRPGWPRAAPKIATVAVLAGVLNAGFLRSPLGARLADPFVPHTILIAWLMAALVRLMASRRSLREPLQPWAVPLRAGLVLAALPFAFVLVAGMSHNFYDRLDKAALVERPGKPFERAGLVARQLREDWRLASWVHREYRPELTTLAMYLNTCTRPTDRVFVQPYIPQVLALSRRAFAGGHADLRPGFFNSPEAQRLTLQRLQRQSVPVVLLETGDSYRNFRRSFPLITPYLDEHYTLAATRVFDGRFGIQFFVRKDRAQAGRFELLDWPCFQ
ncbi:MAG: hypothetical protein ACRD26_04065 [Vicinamibacterales bacterium]